MKRFILLLISFLCYTWANPSPPNRYSISIYGETVYSEDFLRVQLDLPEEFTHLKPDRRDFIIKLAKGNLETFYQSNGYFNSKVQLKMSHQYLGDTLAQHYVFTIHEGEKFRFHKIKLTLPPDALNLVDESELETPSDQFYNPSIISDDIQTIRTLYRRNGFLHVSVDHIERIDTTAHQVDVQFFIDPKAQVKMGKFQSIAFRSGRSSVTDSGLTPGLSDTEWLNELWTIPEGQVIDGKYYSDFRSKLFSTQLFSQVRLEDTLRPDQSGLSNITLTVMERVPGETRYGAFYEETYGFGVSSFSRHKNLYGAFNEGSFSVMIAQNRQELMIGYANPLLFGTAVSFIPTAIRFDDRIYFDHEIIPAPTNADSLVERYSIENRGDLTFGLARNIRVRNTYDASYIRKESNNLFKLKGEVGLDFDFTDNSYDPTLGLRFAPTVGVGGKLEASEATAIAVGNVYTYTNLASALYLPIFKNLLSAVGLSYGKVYDQATEDDAQLFYQGGGRSVRGFRFRSIYPKKITPSPIEGEPDVISAGLSPEYLRINQEFRVILPWKPLRNFQVVEFMDWTRIQDASAEYQPNESMGVGMGLRYKWQFLTIRLDYTLQKEFQTIDPEPFSFSRITFDLSQAI